MYSVKPEDNDYIITPENVGITNDFYLIMHDERLNKDISIPLADILKHLGEVMEEHCLPFN